jgi:hypothetical protein
MTIADLRTVLETNTPAWVLLWPLPAAGAFLLWQKLRDGETWKRLRRHWRRLRRGVIHADAVEWVVNDSMELGVKIGTQFFWLYKGRSLTYDDGTHDNGNRMRWRHVGKREFGECCFPVGTTSIADDAIAAFIRQGGDWQDLPPAPAGQTDED